MLGSCLVMVSQAASQTRFRALKHENGIDGSATIIIRVIACFQPLQDCQVSQRFFGIMYEKNQMSLFNLIFVSIALVSLDSLFPHFP